ncbi:MAG: hypothetical protein J5637_05110 [Prevotella sp.]|nr:hypothetical protein [Prevotella sp.]
MKKYIIPETVVVVPAEDFLEIGLNQESADGDQLSNGALFDDMDDSMDVAFKHKSHIWDDDEAR